MNKFKLLLVAATITVRSENLAEKIILKKIATQLNNSEILTEDSAEKKEILENREWYKQLLIADLNNLQQKWSSKIKDHTHSNLFELINYTAFSCILFLMPNDDRLLYTKIALSSLSFVHFCHYLIQINKIKEQLKKIDEKMYAGIRLLHLLERYE